MLPSRAERLSKLQEICLTCNRCSLYASRHQLVFGDGSPDAWLMFIGEAPGQEEDKTGKPFWGRSGQLLRRMIAAINLTPNDYYIANILKDRPPGNRVPEPEEIEACLPFLKKQIEIINPEYLILLGRTAVKSLLPEQALVPIDALRDKTKDSSSSLVLGNTQVIVTYHPSALLRDPSKKIKVAADFHYLEALANERRSTVSLYD